MALGGFWIAATLDAQPIPLGAEQPVNEVTTSEDFDPTIGVSDAGDLLVAWSRLDGDGSGTGLFGRHTPAGDPAEDEFPINTFTTGSQARPDLDMNGSRDFTVVWESLDQASGTSSFDVVARQSTADGTVLGDEFLAEAVTAGGTLDLAVASDAADGFVFVGVRSSTLIARRFDSDGNGEDELTVALGSVNMRDPDVGVDALGGFVVVWRDADAEDSGIWGRIFPPGAGSPGAIFRVNEEEAGTQSQPGVAVAANGEFVVVWDDFGGALVRIEGRRFRKDGTPVGGDFPISPEDGNHHFPAGLDGHADGSFVVVWTRSIPGEDGPGSPPRGGASLTRVFSREYQRTAQPVDGAFEETAQPGVEAQKQAVVGVGAKFWSTAWVAPDADANGIYVRSYLRRAIFADDFEGAGPIEVWSAIVD